MSQPSDFEVLSSQRSRWQRARVKVERELRVSWDDRYALAIIAAQCVALAAVGYYFGYRDARRD